MDKLMSPLTVGEASDVQSASNLYAQGYFR